MIFAKLSQTGPVPGRFCLFNLFSMQFAEFKMLSLPVQAHIVCEQGVLLCERLEDQYLVALYQVEAFYVEVYYRQPDQEIERFRSFHSTDLLEPYLSQIHFEELPAGSL